ncbi:hypothetical protein BV22DRAFT_1074078 [Leucogyrophana mollusca]|uniref:Uncharacterized protein n=1 Tax=Leucogyrophana mollusca TaxID=85980 RepID=A0ACB8B563_9AGAM|nr:hypothetical protein BV22DRAFT_1074078 [Leucogyrophana mollusca]
MSVSSSPGPSSLVGEDVPPTLARASLRLNFPPSYVVVGVYRLFTDKSLYKPAWDKCRHGARRGLIVGFIWTCLTYKIQRHIIKSALTNPSSFFSFSSITRFSQTANELSHETLFGYRMPFSISTYVAVLLLGSQITAIISFFLSRNIRVARQRAWDQTVASRGKGSEFWQPYVEEWEFPPVVDERPWGQLEKMFRGWFVGMVVRKVLLLPLSLYPFVGTFIAAWFKAIGTAQYLHKPYFEAKKMNPHQVAVWMEERKWDYRLFGFAAALLEGLPIVGLIFTVSNRIGAAMWAHDLEKRQHYIAEKRLHAGGADGKDAGYVTGAATGRKEE